MGTDGTVDVAQIVRDARPRIAPPLVVIAAVVGLELAYGVRLGDALLYLGFEIAFAVIPGVLAYRALARRPGPWLRQVAIGWSLGYALQIVAFMATAAADARVVFLGYPIVVSVSAVWLIRRRRQERAPSELLPTRLGWVVAGVCVVASAYLALSYFPSSSLPGPHAVHYQQDFPWAISLAADALHHWPLQDPNVAGLAMPYHFFVHLHLAAASQVTGLGLPLIVLRLYVLPLLVLLVLQLTVAGQSLVRSASAGIVAAVLYLLVNQLDFLHTAFPLPFFGVSFTFLYTSPSAIFGLVFFVPLLVLVGEAISLREGSVQRGDWLVLTLLMVAASDAKVIILPMLFGALFLYGCWHAVTRRHVPRAVLLSAGLTAAVFGAVWAVQYRGYGSGFHLDLSAFHRFFLEWMWAASAVKDYVVNALGPFPGSGILISTGSVAFGAIGLFGATLAGLVWLLGERRLRVKEREAWLLFMFVVGLLPVLIAADPASSGNVYFLSFGTAAICILSARGLRDAWLSSSSIMRAHPRESVALGLAGAGVLAAAALLGARLLSTPETAGLLPTGPTSGLVGRAYLWSFVVLVAGLGLVVLVGSRWFRGGGIVAAAVVTGVVMIAGLLDTPERIVRSGIRPVAAVASGRRVTPAMYATLRWLRDHTPGGVVTAVNNAEALEFDYAAFSERRTLLGGWGYSFPTKLSGKDDLLGGKVLGAAGPAGERRYSDRALLNDRVFVHADADAAERLAAKFGVRYLIVDRINGFPVDEEGLARIARPVHATSDATIYELPEPRRP